MGINNETLGQTAEKVLCEICGLDASSLRDRSEPSLEDRVRPLLQEALMSLPLPIKHVALTKGLRGGHSKSPVDFICKNGETLSLKTTKNSSFKMCPSECGQPGYETFDHYFGHLYDPPVNVSKFKLAALERIDEMIPIYLEHLFDCDYLLLIYLDSPGDGKIVFKKTDLPSIKWNKGDFTFSKNITNWNESCTVFYKGTSIGEFQAHRHRNCLKFRFHVLNLAKVLGLKT